MSYQTKIVITCGQDSLTIESGSRQIGLWAGCKIPDPETGLKDPMRFDGIVGKMTLETMLEQVGGLGYLNNALVNLMLAKMADTVTLYHDMFEDKMRANEELMDVISVSCQIVG